MSFSSSEQEQVHSLVVALLGKAVRIELVSSKTVHNPAAHMEVHMETQTRGAQTRGAHMREVLEEEGESTILEVSTHYSMTNINNRLSLTSSNSRILFSSKLIM